MHSRRKAREKALQFLFQHDLNLPSNFDEALNCFWDLQNQNPFSNHSNLTQNKSLPRLFADPLIVGVVKNRERLDALIRRHARNWEIGRMAVVDRNVLRLAIYEMLHRDDIPPVVSINEAVDISKRFSTEESGRFVNGILDRIKQDLMRPARTAKPQ